MQPGAQDQPERSEASTDKLIAKERRASQAQALQRQLVRMLVGI